MEVIDKRQGSELKHDRGRKMVGEARGTMSGPSVMGSYVLKLLGYAVGVPLAYDGDVGGEHVGECDW